MSIEWSEQDGLKIFRDENGSAHSLMFNKAIPLETTLGLLMPNFSSEDMGRNKHAAVKLYNDGEVKSLPLAEATLIESPLGMYKAELLTFHQSGKLNRIFPLNGRTTGYWTEENEFALAEEVVIDSPAGKLFVKPIYMSFYESGALLSVALWPKEKVYVNTPLGTLCVETGVSFYENGQVKSLELSSPTVLKTPIGDVEAYNNEALGISAENNSLNFYEDGRLKSFFTTSQSVEV
ncbi:MAG: hypothetical protein HQL32_16830, partial [Planctomycetes bacterium]|nr:hypothetical protein [Planctomycetota bacterium]